MNIEVVIPKAIFDVEKFKRLQRAHMASVALAVKRDFEATVKNWDHKPTFEVQYSSEEITVGTDDDIYALVDAGSPSHTISPVRAKRLKFQNKYKAKSTPGVIGSKRGGKSGEIVTAKVVRHPGFQARKFLDAIAKKNNVKFFQGGDAAVAEANK